MQGHGDIRFTDYTAKRLGFIKTVVDHYRQLSRDGRGTPVRSVLNPGALDDAGSMCAAMIKAERAGLVSGLRSMIQNYIDYISNDQFRLEDNSRARKRISLIGDILIGLNVLDGRNLQLPKADINKPGK